MNALTSVVSMADEVPYRSPIAAAWPCTHDGEFAVGGMALSQVVDAVGGTPCYLYDRAYMAERVTRLRRALSQTVELYYAIKANPMPAVVAHVARLLNGLDVASAGEMRVALDAGVAAEKISFAGPGKSEEELLQAYASNVLVNVESRRELHLLAKMSERSGRAARIALRVNLPFELKASGMKMTGGARQFGIDAEDVPRSIAETAALGLKLEGFHLFTGSQSLHAEAVIEAQRKSYECAREWAELTCEPIKSINLGGGLGIPYGDADARISEEEVVTHLNCLAEETRRDFDGVSLVLELGRYLVGEAGLYVSRVIDRKVSRGKTFLVVDGGMHQHLAASGNFGQVLRKNYPVAINGKLFGNEVSSVVGPLCTPLDLLASNAKLGRAEQGDLVVIFQSGAYGRSASPSGFLGHPAVREALV
ncbi:pyridoxal-dependent decarboxylase, exosortase A system-associated [Herbaspirillum seropedicae]|uniref:pyridoxal-dependent decarboxylase, exosortase A system-associated n=1 Tax=Herbaspirillum seropedicae TaxID=964 RepID=UPI000863C4DE|nr:pyridoxal-dependent decarboxylase, exosortase A system-associated [Herbaspirillum seropedicae]AON53770.1 diaminopimelate decarboxylase [Herbaspirillum seropedicae]